MSEMIVINDWLEKDYLDYLHMKILYDYPHTFGEKSQIDNKDHIEFYYAILKEEDKNFLHYKLIKTFNKKIKILRAYANIQHPGMDGDWHTDEGTTTYLLMLSNTLMKGKGMLEIEDKKINFIQNQLVAFPSNLSHRGLSADSNNVRITIAFKTINE